MNITPSLTHPNQASFMKGRKIEDQVKLAKFLLNYAEAAEEDGMIVALDQEKAYDSINQTYLVGVLNRWASRPNFATQLQQLAVPKAQIKDFLFWDVSKEFPIPQSVLNGLT